MKSFSIKIINSLTHLSKSIFLTSKYVNIPHKNLINQIFTQQVSTAHEQGQIKTHLNLNKDILILNKVNIESELYCHQNYSFRLLAHKHKNQALQLLTEAFDEKQPITFSFNLKHSENKLCFNQNWSSYWKFFIDELICSGLSVAVFDTNNFDQMIGIVVAKDYHLIAQGYDQKFMSSYNVVSQMMGLANFMINRIDDKNQQIMNKNQVIDLFGGTIKPKHQGKKLFSKILELNLQLGKKRGYNYAFTYVTNFKSELTLKKLKFEKIGDYDCTKYQQEGSKPFELVQQIHKNPSVWLKHIS